MNEVSNDPGAVVVRAPRSVLVTMSENYGMEPAAFEATLRATVVPDKITREQFAAFLLVANQYGLNPILKEIYAFPTRSGGIQPIVGVDGWANLINSHPACDGIVFNDTLDEEGNLTAVTCEIFRKDRSHPTTATEYMTECRRNTDTWRQWPRRMLRHKALIQAARYAFGFSGIVDPDEWERSPENQETPRQRRAQPKVVQASDGPRKPLPPLAGQAEPEPVEDVQVVTEEPAESNEQTTDATIPETGDAGRAATLAADQSSPAPETDGTVDPLLERARDKANEGGTVFDAWAKRLTDKQIAKLEPHMPELVQRCAAADQVPA